MQILKSAALSFLNTPYRWGGDDPDGLDCSGLIQEILATAGMWEPNRPDVTSQGLYNFFEKEGTWNDYSCGALLFYGKSCTRITHVAFALDQYRCIEAAGGGSKTKTKQDALRQNAFVRIRLIKRRSDLVAVIKPKYVHIGII